MVTINALLATPLLFYIVSRNERIHIFSPFILPTLIFSIYYLIPSTILSIIAPHEITFAERLYAYGILSFYGGVLLLNRIRFEPRIADRIPDNRILSVISIVGLCVLLAYGSISGVLSGILNGSDVEQLRRDAEIGRGYLKDTGYFLLIFSILIFSANKLDSAKCKSLHTRKSFYLIALVSLFVFINIGHKAASLLPVLIYIAVWNRKFNIKSHELILLFALGLSIIGILNTLRSGSDLGSLQSKAFNLFYIYEHNYIPLVNLVSDGAMPLQMGREYITGMVALIPRFIWPDKPISFDYFLKDELGRVFDGGGLPSTIIGSLYINFGIFGVIFIMFLIGALYSILYKTYRASSIIHAPALCFLMYSIMNPSQLFSAINYFLAFYLPIYFISMKRPPWRSSYMAPRRPFQIWSSRERKTGALQG